ncbi:tetratricopeptide repeat protein [Xanthobacter tagetidis]|nr:sel1 repeat family protein [Xanthobacter tagetidis]MBB6309774.1 type IV secretory pathway VirB10-like protein [Xanthobacter tagetidis]
MGLRVMEDEAAGPGHAVIDLGRPVTHAPVLLAFRRLDGEPRDLGPDGWQSGLTWIEGRPVDGGAGSQVRVGPEVVDHIAELVMVEILDDQTGSLGTVSWPALTRSAALPRGVRLSRSTSAPSSTPEPTPDPKPAPTPASPPRLPPVTPPAPPPLPPLPDLSKAPELGMEPQHQAASTAGGRGTGVRRLPAPAWAALLLLALFVLAAILAGSGRHGYELTLAAEPHFRETSRNVFAPAAVDAEIRRAAWVRLFEGWLLRTPPAANLEASVPWLRVRLLAEDSTRRRYVLTLDGTVLPQQPAQTGAITMAAVPGGALATRQVSVARLPPPPTPSADPPSAPAAPPPAPSTSDAGDQCDFLLALEGDPDLPYQPERTFSAAPVAQRMAEGIDACTRARAEARDARDQRRYTFQLGRAYSGRALDRGRGGDNAGAFADMDVARGLWESAARAGSLPAKRQMGILYRGSYNGGGITYVQPNTRRAFDYFFDAANAGYVTAMRDAGAMLLYGADGLAQDIRGGEALLRRAIDAGDADSMSLLGRSLYFGDPPGLAKNTAEGLGLVQQSCVKPNDQTRRFFNQEIQRGRLGAAQRPAGCE